MLILRDSLSFILFLLYVILLTRLIFEFIQAYARSWTPHGITLVLAESVYTITDPPVKFLRRRIPPLSLGGLRLDMALLILFVSVSLARFLLSFWV